MDIRTKPLVSGIRSLGEFYGTVFVLSLIGMVAIMLLELFLQFRFFGPEYQLPRSLLLPVLLAAATPGCLFGIWFARKQSSKQFWRLTDTELSCGSGRPQRFPLANIDRIILGLPEDVFGKVFRQAKPGTVAGYALDSLSAVDPQWKAIKGLSTARAEKENSLLICFKDGSWLPLRLFLLPNGTAIMDALKERFKDHLIESHHYSAQELRRLHRCDVNELIPAPK